MKRLDTKLESTSAEFLVLGNLLLRRISAYKTYQNFPGYDLVAVNSEKNLSVTIQVKSRYKTNWNGFIIKNYDACNFVVLVALNRGFNKVRKNDDTGVKNPDYYVFPISYIKKIKNNKNSWGKITKSAMKGYLEYKDRWDLIEEFLKQ